MDSDYVLIKIDGETCAIRKDSVKIVQERKDEDMVMNYDEDKNEFVGYHDGMEFRLKNEKFGAITV